jgi:hypothetical protein
VVTVARPIAGRPRRRGAQARTRRSIAAALLLAPAACSHLDVEPEIDRIRTPIANPSWSTDLAPILRETCGSSGACHGGATPQVGLLLEGSDAAMYAANVNVASVFRPSMMLIRPGQPDSSFLLRIMSEDPAVRFGNRRMPLTQLPMPQPVQQTIRNWIQNGAPNN